MGAAGDGEFQAGRASEFDGVMRISRADLHLQFHVNFFDTCN